MLDKAANSPAPVATLTLKKWEPKPDPLADLYAPVPTTTLRQRLAENDAEPLPEPQPITQPEVVAEPEPPRGFVARLFNQLRRRPA